MNTHIERRRLVNAIELKCSKQLVLINSGMTLDSSYLPNCRMVRRGDPLGLAAPGMCMPGSETQTVVHQKSLTAVQYVVPTRRNCT